MKGFEDNLENQTKVQDSLDLAADEVNSGVANRSNASGDGDGFQQEDKGVGEVEGVGEVGDPPNDEKENADLGKHQSIFFLQ